MTEQHLIEVEFTGNRREFFLWEEPEPPAPRTAVIVEAERGEDMGYVRANGELAEKRSLGCTHGCGSEAPKRRALRVAAPGEIKQGENLRKLSAEARRHAIERVRGRGLVMKISDAEWQWDRRKLTFYFTAEHRVDFRDLVRDLATQFRTRIELKQIGVRDEAKRLDGVGRCGRQYCSASWLPELRPVNLGVAKEQRLSLNPAQISGACGRLMCCLRYEHEVYVAARKKLPKEGRVFSTRLGEEKVLAVDIFHERVTLRGVEGETRVVSLATFREETGFGSEAIAAPAVESVPTESELAFANEEILEAREMAELATTDAATDALTAVDPRAKRRRGRRGGRGNRRRGPDDRRNGGDRRGGPDQAAGSAGNNTSS